MQIGKSRLNLLLNAERLLLQGGGLLACLSDHRINLAGTSAARCPAIFEDFDGIQSISELFFGHGKNARDAGEFLFNGVLGRMFIYSNPLVIASALFLLLTFSKLRLQSKAINWLAASSFAVFLMHSNPNVAEPYFVPLCRQLHASWGTAYFALILPVIAGFFLVSVLVDQVRIRVWLRIEQPVERLIKRCMEKL